MRRFFLVVSILMILILPSAIVLAGGPADKAIGCLTMAAPGGYIHRVSLNAREEDGIFASGRMIYTIFGPDNKIEQRLQYDIVYADISDNKAKLGVICTYDSLDLETGDWKIVGIRHYEPKAGTFGMAGPRTEAEVILFITTPVVKFPAGYKPIAGNIKILT